MIGSRPLSESEVESILRLVSERENATRNTALFTFYLKTGFRVSEGLVLRLRDVWAFPGVRAEVAIAKRWMKGKHQGRTVVLHGAAREALARWVTERFGPVPQKSEAETLLFPITRRQVGRLLASYAAVLELSGKVSTHSWRKTFAKRVHEKLGGDIVATCSALGHSDIRTTQRYLQANADKVDSAILDV